MAGSLTNEGEKLALNLLFRNTGSSPTNIYLGLATNTSLSEAVTMADITEVDDAGYARQEVLFAEPMLVNEKQTIENNSQQEFGPWSEDEDAGINYVFLTDSSSGTGKVLGLYKLPNEKTPAAGEALVVTAGNCGINMD